MALRVIPTTERCSSCYSTVEFEYTDVVQTNYYDDEGKYICEKYIECPICGNRIIVDRY